MAKLSIRPLIESDILHIINYWFAKSNEDLIQMGVDKMKLGSPEDFQTSLAKTICASPGASKYFYMIWLIEGQEVGYASLKDIEKGELATMHLHLWDAQLRGKGYGAQLFCMSVIQFYAMFNFKLILCEPKSTNPMPNRMLTKIGFKQWRTYFAAPADISLLTEFNTYVVDLEVAQSFLEDLQAKSQSSICQPV